MSTENLPNQDQKASNKPEKLSKVSGIAAIGVPEYGDPETPNLDVLEQKIHNAVSKGWEGEKFSLLRDQETIASDRTEELNYKEQQIERLAEIERVEKEAHNAAIDACLDLMDSNQALYHAHSRLKTDIQKLKL